MTDISGAFSKCDHSDGEQDLVIIIPTKGSAKTPRNEWSNIGVAVCRQHVEVPPDVLNGP